MPNPGLLANKKALICSNLEVGLSPAKVAKFMNISNITVYTYYKNLQDYNSMSPLTQEKLGLYSAISVYMEDVSINLVI